MSHASKLSAREEQLVRFAAEGLTDTGIAHALGISEGTVGTYWARVRAKMGAHSRSELVGLYVRQQCENAIRQLREQNMSLIDELQNRAGSTMVAPDFNYYRSLILGAADPILIVDEGGRIVVANDECASAFGYGSCELDGQPIAILIPERYRQIHEAHMIEYDRHPSKRRMAEHMIALGLTKEGVEFPIAASLSPVETPAGLRVMCILRKVGQEYSPVVTGMAAGSASD